MCPTQRWIAVLATVSLATACATLALIAATSAKKSPGPASTEILKTESNLVLVDAIVTDKKGHYVNNLTEKDFRVYDDGKLQTLTSFSEASATAASGARRYVVLFFDDSTIATSDQLLVRRAAAQFVQRESSPHRLMAVVDFAGVLHIEQNFTNNAALLAHAVRNVQFSGFAPNVNASQPNLASLAGPRGMLGPSLQQVSNDFAARTVLLSIRSLCLTLAAVAGRKALILFSAGFPLNSEREAELSATIDAANKANVAIYPVDVRGLTNLPANPFPNVNPTPGFPPGARLEPPPFPHEPFLLADLSPVAFAAGQRGSGAGSPAPSGPSGGRGGAPSPGGSGTGTGPGTGNVGTGGTTGSTGGLGRGNPGSVPGFGGRGGGMPGNGNFNSPGFYNNNMNQMPPIIPPMIQSMATNQQVLYALAEGTGGFAITNTSDFLSGLMRISKDLNHYYVLGYVPPNRIHDGSYHRIRVKVDRRGLTVRARNGYYDTKSPDMLAGKPEGQLLQALASSPKPGTIFAAMTDPYFYTAPGVARVNVSLQIPAKPLHFRKEKGRFHYEVNVLGLAYRAGGAVAARFSDTDEGSLDKQQEKQLLKGAFHYQNSFDIAPGAYKLVVVLSTGRKQFAKCESSLLVRPYSGNQFAISAIALSHTFRPISELTASLDEELINERMPLVSRGIEVTPSASNRFNPKEEVGFYVEVYDPDLQTILPPEVGVLYTIYNRKSGQLAYSSDTIPVNVFAEPGNPIIPSLIRLQTRELPPGSYRLDVQARDSDGHISPVEKARFSIE